MRSTTAFAQPSARRRMRNGSNRSSRAVRFTIARHEQRHRACLDELEVWSVAVRRRRIAQRRPGAELAAGRVPPATTQAHRSTGSRISTTASTATTGAGFPNATAQGWVQIDFAEPTHRPHRLGPRPAGRFADRLPTDYRIEVAGTRRRVDRSRAAPPTRRPYRCKTADGLRRHVRPAGRSRRGACTAAIRCAQGSRCARRAQVLGSPRVSPLDAPEQQRRLALADWIASPRQSAHRPRDGQPHLAASLRRRAGRYAERLRRNGTRPTHPELLDWLARQFIDDGWSLKHMHRLIVLSSTYQQASEPRAIASPSTPIAAAVALPAAAAGGRGDPRFDLAVSGTLDLTMGGPGWQLSSRTTTTSACTSRRRVRPGRMAADDLHAASPHAARRRVRRVRLPRRRPGRPRRGRRPPPFRR